MSVTTEVVTESSYAEQCERDREKIIDGRPETD